MRLSISTALLALASAVYAQTAGFDAITKPTSGEVVPAGSTYKVVWLPGTGGYNGTVTLNILGGASPATLIDLGVIGSGVDTNAGTFDWTVSPTLGKDMTYGIKITLDSNKSVFQFSFPFSISGGGANTASTSGGSGTGTTTAPTGGSSSTTTGGSGSSSTSLTSPTSAATTTTSTKSTTTSSTSTSTKTTTSSTTTSASKTTTTAVGPQSSNHAESMAASSLALFGGLALAVFAL